MSRVRAVVIKLARGHAAFELGVPQIENPDTVAVVPLLSLSSAERKTFETEPVVTTVSEVGSRNMQRLIQHSPTGSLRAGWISVQEGRYRYMAFVAGRVLIRMVLSEYLAAEVTWV